MMTAEMDNAQFAQIAQEMTIFGRITPQQKARLVQALRDHHHYVAMIGDGINDVLAPKQKSILTFITASIISVALAAWAHPGHSLERKLSRTFIHFIQSCSIFSPPRLLRRSPGS